MKTSFSRSLPSSSEAEAEVVVAVGALALAQSDQLPISSGAGGGTLASIGPYLNAGNDAGGVQRLERLF